MYIFAGTYRKKPIETPKGSITRPTTGQVREAVFNICQNDISEARFLDLFAGSGAMGLEALSRGASRATFVENDRNAIQCIQNNIRNFSVETKTRLFPNDVFLVLQRLEKQKETFDVIYADPPFTKDENGTLTQKLIQAIEKGDFLTEMGRFFIESSQKEAPQPSLFFLKDTRRYGCVFLHQYIRRESNG